MSFSQNIARHVLSDRLYESMRAESETWVMRCPCGSETSVWQMGGIRWKAAGEPRRMGKCGACRRVFWGTVYRQNGSLLTSESTNRMSQAPMELDRTSAVLLWIDGVGCWIVFPHGRVTIGGPVEPGSNQRSADLCVLANLRRTHAVIERVDETWRLQTVDSDEATYLRDGGNLNLGVLAMRFRVPSVLSLTAVLTPSRESWPRMFTGQRTPATLDGVVLMDEVCLLGPGSDAHVRCEDWEETVILFRRDGQLWCRSQSAIDVDGQPASGGLTLASGSLVSGNGWRFRVEGLPTEV